MTTATRSVAVVATRLPSIDRRALSQAWFSALHLAQPRSGSAVRAAHSAALPVTGLPLTPARTAAPPAAPAPAPRGNGSFRRGPAAGPANGFAAAERRAPAGELSRRIERAVARHAACPPLRTTAVAIAAAGGRVHVLVRTDGATTRIIALCAPALRERVDRALAHARFVLAAAGTHVEVAG
jgi:hypothetical protein